MSDQENNAEPDFGDDFAEDPFAEFEQGGGSGIGELIRTNPMAKVGVVVGVVVLIVLATMFFGGEEKKRGAVVGGGSTIKQAPGEEVSPAYEEAVKQKNIEEVEKAMKKGGSAIPVPIGDQSQDRVQIPDVKAPSEDPLERWRRIQEERQKQEAQKMAGFQKTPAAGDPNAEIIRKLSEAMARQMQSVLQSLDPEKMQRVSGTAWDYFEQLEKKKTEEEKQQTAAAVTAAAAQQFVTILVPAGTIEYAQLITEANSDVPAPILAQIVSGPLAGSRMLGSFKTENDYLVLEFNTVVIDGISHPISALALDPATTKAGLVTEIDNRYFQRVVLPAAASFIEGMGSAIADTGSTTVTVQQGAAVQEQNDLNTREELFKGVEKAASKVSEFIDDYASEIRPMIKVAAGTPMGILFLAPVTDQASQ